DKSGNRFLDGPCHVGRRPSGRIVRNEILGMALVAVGMQGLRITVSQEYRLREGFPREDQGLRQRRNASWRCSTWPGGRTRELTSGGGAGPGSRRRFACSRDCDLRRN